MEHYAKHFITGKDLFFEKELISLYDNLKLEEGFFSNEFNSVKNLIKGITKCTKKFSTSSYIPVKAFDSTNNRIEIRILYPDNRMGSMSFNYDYIKGNLKLVGEKGSLDLINTKHLINISAKEFINVLKTIAQYCHHKIYKNEYYDFDKMKNGKGIIIA